MKMEHSIDGAKFGLDFKYLTRIRRGELTIDY